eukprot:992673-Karenia_brevis.AAC.2
MHYVHNMLHVLSSPGVKCSSKCPYKNACIDPNPPALWKDEATLNPCVKGHDYYLQSAFLPWPEYKRIIKPSH